MALLTKVHDCPLLDRIGEGGVADVFRSEWEGQEVALKVLRDPERSSVRKRFLHEGRLLQRIAHPGLVRCLHIFDGDSPALVLELLRGEPLDQCISRRPLGADEVMHLAISVLQVLQHIHELGVVHRDVKSSNVFCGSDNRIVLMDLGLAADLDLHATTLGDVLGTYAYMAPEQIAGAETDHRCDLYSLGVTLYEAVCGARPYAARTAAAWLAAHRGGTATPLSEVALGVPVRLTSLVERLMARDPAARPPSAGVALALLNGASGPRSELRRPTVLAREGARGAIAAVLDAPGQLQITGPLGSGFAPLARLAREAAADARVEVVAFRGRSRMRRNDVLRSIAEELVRFGMPRVETMESARAQLDALVQEGTVLLLAEDVDQLGAEAQAALVALSDVGGLAVVHLGVELESRPGVRVHRLRPLNAADIRELLRTMLNSRSVPSGLDAALRAASGGLASHTVALVREQVLAGTLWCEGLAENGDPAWRWNVSAGLVSGESTRRLLERIVRRLAPAEKAALETLSIADDPVPVDVLGTLFGGDGTGLEVGRLVAQGLVLSWNEGGEEWVAVARSSVERLIREDMADARRRRIHLALADAVEARARGEWEQRFVIFHRSLGTRGAEATLRLLELGESLASAGRPNRALRVLEHLPPNAAASAIARAALARAEALRAAGRLGEALDALAAASQLARALEGAPDVARIEALELELLVALGSIPSEALVQRLGDRAGAGEPHVLLALGELAVLRGQFDTATALFDAAIAASPSGIERVPVAARIGGALVHLLRGKVTQAERRLLTLVRELHGRDRRTLLSAAYLALARVQRVRGQFSRCLASVAIAGDLHGRSDVPAFEAASDVLRAWAYAGVGDVAAAGEALTRVTGALVGGVSYEVRALYFEVLGELRRALGDTPSTLAAHLGGLDAAGAADDAVRVHFHEAMAGMRMANARLLSGSVGRLVPTGAHRHLALVYLVGADIGRDLEILQAAEAEARASEDPSLLLDVLYVIRTTPTRIEASAIARVILESLSGGMREKFLDLPATRWAMEEPGRVGHDKAP